MEFDKFSGFLFFLVPPIVQLIMQEYNLSDEKATELFYASALYATLEEEKTKLWHLSAHALFSLFQEEQTTGKITYPEEG
ncbi:MAG: hypothetical protein LBN05_07330 [Oscillospiraceae bacterium]|jgi:hypothetical protein|nr:hypothetical protein [Oscillospiraceae bacterium]